VEVVNL